MKHFPVIISILFSVAVHLVGFAQDFGADIDKALSLEADGRYTEAAELYAKWLPQAKKELGENDTSLYLRLVRKVGNCFFLDGHYKKAEPFMKEALYLDKKNLGESHADYGTDLNNLAQLYLKLGNYEQSEVLMKEAIDLALIYFGMNQVTYVTRLNNLAQLYIEMGRYEQAEQLMKKAMQIGKEALGENNPDYGVILSNFALSNLDMARYEQAEKLMKEAMKIAKDSQGANHPGYASKLDNLAQIYVSMGRYDLAEPLLEEAIRIDNVFLGKNHPKYGGDLSNLANLLTLMGRFEDAAKLMLEVLRIDKSTFGENHPRYAQHLHDLAFLCLKLGLDEQAEPLMKKAIRIELLCHGENNSNIAIDLTNLAQLFQVTGQYELAEPLMEEAMRIDKEFLGENHPKFGRDLKNLAMLYVAMGYYEQAEPLMKEAMRIDKAIFGENHPDFGRDLSNLAMMYVEMGYYEKAKQLFEESYLNLKYNLRKNSSYLSEFELTQFQENEIPPLGGFQSFNYQQILTNEGKGDFALNIEFYRKGLLLNSVIETRKRIINSGDTSLINNFQTMMDIRKQVDKIYTMPLEQRYEDPVLLEEKANRIEKGLKMRSKEYSRGLEELEITWKQVQEKLSLNEAAIEFSSFPYYNKHWTDSTLYCALILKKGMEFPVIVPLFEQKQLDSLLAGDNAMPNSLYATRGVTAYYGDQLPNGQKLYNLIWKPLEKELQNVKTVYYSPSGSLHLISFAALPTDTAHYLCDKYNLVQLSSTRQLATSVWQNKPGQISSTALFGGIKYDLENQEIAELQRISPKRDLTLSRGFISDSTLRSASFGYLKGTNDEVEAISTTLRSKKVKTELYTGINGNEEAFKALSNQTISVLHIATHGFFYPDEKQKPQDLDRMMLRGEQKFRYVPNPLRRSGLILAGGNRIWKGEEPVAGMEDGILTAQEISEMNLQNTELVVLSACETGLGDIKGGEGVFGLQRAFKLAGVKTIIMSLWKVPDGSTSEMMQLFYSKWLGGLDKQEAFRETQREMRNRYPKSPKDWAGFVMLD
jgi:CHAT domain-containing protein/tetratricopeptide (TPR) repeat protein